MGQLTRGFKTGVSSGPAQAGSIPVRLRQPGAAHLKRFPPRRRPWPSWGDVAFRFERGRSCLQRVHNYSPMTVMSGSIWS